MSVPESGRRQGGQLRDQLAADMKQHQLAARALDGRLADLQTRAIETAHASGVILHSGAWRTLVQLGGAILKALGRSPGESAPMQPGSADYQRWIAEFERPEIPQLMSPSGQPLISIIVPASAPAEPTLLSVLRQSCENWELCLAGAAPSASWPDARIRAIPARVSEALQAVSGEYVALLGQNDELAPNALRHVVEIIQRERDVGVLYSDDDCLEERGVRSNPFFKPDWSPDLILSTNYMRRLMVFRRDLGLSAGGLGAGEHHLILEMSLRTKRIVHIPKILYHWRTSADAEQASACSTRTVEEHLRRTGNPAQVEPARWPGHCRVRYPIPDGLRVSVLLPTAGRLDILKRCLDDLVEKTDYPYYDVSVADNSSNVGVERYLHTWRGGSARYLDWRYRPFNFSAMNNNLARATDAPLLLFLNDDTRVIDSGWLTAMVELAARPDVGVVGAKLLYPNGRIQHVGVVLGIFGVCGHGMRDYREEGKTHFGFPDLVRNVSAVTGACLMIRSELFWQVGGFDEIDFPVAYQDIDLCLKVRQAGFRVLYTPYSRLYHQEGVSKRGEDRDARFDEICAFRAKWRHAITSDPFYNPNLTLTAEDYSYRRG